MTTSDQVQENINVVFASNFLTDHQLPFCLAMVKLTGGHFYFIATAPIAKQRIDLGFKDMHKEYPFVIRAYESDDEARRAHALAADCDLLIYGSAPQSYIDERIKKGRFTFVYTERLYKKSIWQAFSPRGIIYDLKHHWRWRNKQVYLLCASAYAAYDYSLHGCYRGKAYKWGYFPTVVQRDIDKLFAKKNANTQPTILWAGRMIDWKHPEAVIALCERLGESKKDFCIRVIGCGDMEEQLRKTAEEKKLESRLLFLGAQPPEKVREYMEMSDIFIATSDQNEGWGAVINEAMNSACAVVASASTGSAPYLIRSGENGLLYRSCNWDDMSNQVIRLLSEPDMRRRMGTQAYEDIIGLWNADIATRRIINLYRWLAKIDAEDPGYKDGPCSRADRLH